MQVEYDWKASRRMMGEVTANMRERRKDSRYTDKRLQGRWMTGT